MRKPTYFTPVVTAFLPDGNIDEAANVAVWDNLIKGGVTGIVVMGSTGEFFSMSPDQKRGLIKLASEHIKGRVKFFVGTGNMRADDTIALSNFAFEYGADGVMIVGPYYFALSDDNIESYFTEVAKKVNGNIFLYNFPDRTGYDLKPSITLKLLRAQRNITGYKDTVGSMSHTRELISTVRRAGEEDFIILSGKDENFVHTLLCGGDGSIGGWSNLFPELAGAWIKAVRAGDVEQMSAIQKTMDRVNDIGGAAPFIPGLKRAMIIRGIFGTDVCQFPFAPVNDAQAQKIKAIIDEVEPEVKELVKA